MKHLTKNLLIVIGGFVALTALFSFVAPAEKKPEQLTIDALVSQINAGTVKKIVIQGEEVRVTLSDDRTAHVRKEPDASFTETLTNYGVDRAALQKVAFSIEEDGGTGYWLSILLPSLIPIVLMVVLFFWIFRQAKGGVNQAFTFGKATMRLAHPSKDKVSFKDVAGLREAKDELEEVVEFLKQPKKFLQMGAKIPRGVLLVGQPGTGKTLLARAVAGESNVPFFHLSASEFVEMFVGVGASRVRDLFQTAKKAAPAIIFIDEIDAVGRERGAGMGGGHDEREQTLNQILVEMDGFDRNTNVIVMAATNRPDILDSALLRPGRFDRRVILDMPDMQDREAILKIHTKGKPLDKGVNLAVIAVRTPGFAGADLANLLNEAALLAARHNRSAVLQDDIINSIEKVLLGPARTSRVVSDHEKKVTAYHEAGHALVATVLKDADPVHKVSIVSRGLAGGYTLKLPLEERRLKTRAQFLADLAVAFGGYVAELVVFKDLTTGSSSDIAQATDIAHALVTRFGMSDVLGPRTFGKTSDFVFLGREVGAEKDYSESTGQMIDAEVNAVIAKTLAAAKKIITGNRPALDAIAKTLIEKETLEQDAFNALMKQFNIRPNAIR